MSRERITIVDGTPEFDDAVEAVALSIEEGPVPKDIRSVRVTAGEGDKSIRLFRRARARGRKMVLEYPDEWGLRHEVPIIAARFWQTEELDIVDLWVDFTDQ